MGPDHECAWCGDVDRTVHRYEGKKWMHLRCYHLLIETRNILRAGV